MCNSRGNKKGASCFRGARAISLLGSNVKDESSLGRHVSLHVLEYKPKKVLKFFALALFFIVYFIAWPALPPITHLRESMPIVSHN